MIVHEKDDDGVHHLTCAGAAFDRAATCTVTPELTEGPFYFDVDSIRSDIREDREGTLLRVALRVRAGQIVSIIGAKVGSSRAGVVCATVRSPATRAVNRLNTRSASQRRVGSVGGT